MERTEGLNHLASNELAERRESLGGNEHRKTERIVSVPHPYPLHFYHFSAVQPNLQLPAPASRFPRAFSGGSVHMHGRPEIAENSSPQSRLQYCMTPAPSSLEGGDCEVCFTQTPRVPQQDSALTAHIGNLLHNTPSIWLL